MGDTEILLIHPFSGKRTFCPPLGALYIAAALRDAGYQVTLLDLDVDDVPDKELARLLMEKKPLFTGVSCNVVQVNEVLRLSRILKESYPGRDGKVVVGGPMPSALPELFLSHPEGTCIDICVVGEGDRTVVELAGALKNSSPLTEIAGLAFKGSDKGSLIKTPPRDFIVELDRLPFPAHDLNGDINRYAKMPSPAPFPPIAAVLPSRGCPFRCTFCSNPWQGTNRKRSVENVVQEIAWLVSEFRVKEIFFYDDSFNSDPDYVKELCTRITESKLKISWRADCRANRKLLDDEMLRLMKESGCWLLAFGVETGNRRIMASIKKGLNLSDVQRARDLCKNAGILFRSFFMIGNLGDDYSTVFDTIRFARELDPDDCQFSIFTPVIGTVAYERAKENGWIIDRRWEKLDSFHPTVSTDKLSTQDTEALHRLGSLTVPSFWKDSLQGVRRRNGEIAKKMQEAYGHKGRMIYELWGSYTRNRQDDRPVVVLNPPSPPGFTSSKDTMGGLGQVFRGDYMPVIPPVDMAYMAAGLRKEGVPVHVIDAPGSFLDVEHTMKFIASLSPSRVMIRTSVPTEEWDRSLGDRIAAELDVAVEYFGPCVPGEPPCDLKDPLIPAWDLFPSYNLGSLTENRRYLPIQGSRGCPYACDYCPYPVTQGKTYIARDPEDVFSEMLHWKKELGVDYFLFRDPVFSLRREWGERLFELLKGKGINWRCETRADLLPKGLLDRMAGAGCAGINLGLETITKACLHNVRRKPVSLEKLKSVVNKCKELGIETFVFYIVGLPGETRDSFQRTLQLARELDSPHVQFLPATPYPGTVLERWARERGFITGSLTDPRHYGTEPVMRNECMTISEIKELCEMANGALGARTRTVSAVRCEAYEKVAAAVKEAVDQLGGIGVFVKPDQRVLLKPNLIGPYPPDKAVTTHPAVVQAVAELVKSAGGIPLIGDSPGGGEVYRYKNYQTLLRVTGMDAAAQRAGCETVDFSTAGISTIPVEGKLLKEAVITDAALKADVIISLPKIKTHAFQYFTGAIKNLYGLVPGLKKAEYHKLAPSPEEFASLMVDVFQAVKSKVKLVIMDGVVSMDGRGPTAGRPVKTDFVLAAKDAVVADAAACLILGLDPQQSPIIAEACQRFFKGERLDINIRGEKPANLKVHSFQAPFYESQDSFIETHANIYPYIDSSRCKQCRKCIEACPVKTILPGQDFVVETRNCIKCLCCFEVCPHNAIELIKRVDKTPRKAAPAVARNAKDNGRFRVLVLSNLYPPHFIGGYELACGEIADRLRERGHEVMVLTSMFGFEGPKENGHVRRILDHSYASGDDAVFLDMPFSAYNEHIIKKALEDFRPYSIYLWNFHGLSMQSVMKTVLSSNIPYVFHAMDYHLLAGYGSLQKWQEPLATEFLASERCRIIAMSQTVRVKFLRQGYLNTHLVYHGVEVVPASAGKEKTGGEGFRLIYTGQVRQGKGLHVLIQALHGICKGGHPVSLDIFGGGDPQYEEQLRRFVEDNRMPVVFQGSLPRAELLERYGQYDAFVLPTLREEPFGIVMIEAMNAGLPVVASGEGGPKEIITHGETGLWFPTGDIGRLQDCIIELASSKELRRKLSEKGRQVVREKFDIEKSVSRIEELLNFAEEPSRSKKASEEKGCSEGIAVDFVGQAGKGVQREETESDETVEGLLMLVKNHPGDAALHNRLGEALFHSGEHEKAKFQFEKALQLDPGCIEAQNNLGAVFWATGKIEEALDRFRGVLEVDEDNLDALVNYATACAQSGKDGESVELLQKYLSLVDEDSDVRLTLAEVLWRIGKKEQALEELQAILKVNPANQAVKELLSIGRP